MTRRRSFPVWFVIAILLGQAGCITHPFEPSVSESVRMQLGTVGVAAMPHIPEAHFLLPAKGWARGMGRGAGKGALNMIQGGLQQGGGDKSGAGALVLALALALTPPAALVGGAYGAIAAEPAAKVEEADTALKNALAELKIQETFQGHVFQVARELTRHSFVVLPGQDSSGQRQAGGSVALPGQEMKTVLETDVQSVHLQGEWGVNPSLRLVVKIAGRLANVEDGKDLAVRGLEYVGGEYTFAEWAADNARLFHDELDRAYKNLSESLVEEMFLLHRFSTEVLLE